MKKTYWILASLFVFFLLGGWLTRPQKHEEKKPETQVITKPSRNISLIEKKSLMPKKSNSRARQRLEELGYTGFAKVQTSCSEN